MSTTLTIGGSSVSVPRDLILGKCLVYARGGMPSLSVYARGRALPVLPDPYLGKPVTLTIGGTTRFVGDVVSAHPEYDAHLGWVRAYQCLGLRNRGDWFPHTDSNTGIDGSGYNLSAEDPAYLPARAGRTVGQVLLDVLTMTDNATALDAAGIGAYASLSPPTLPASTLADLAAMTFVPPGPVYFQGEKFLGGVEAFLSQWAPNHVPWIDPTDGTMRFLDQRAFADHTLTMGTDPILPTPLSRDVSDCFQKVVTRGSPLATMFLLKTSQSTLTEAFTWGAMTTNALAKADWNPSKFKGNATYQDHGTCTCPSTTTITVTSSDAAQSWASNALDQTTGGRHATINAIYSIGTGIDIGWTARVVANTALSPAGTSTLTIDAALPHLLFDKYTLSWIAQDASIVWRKYRIADATIRAKVAQQSTYPQPFVNAGGGVSMTSTPVAAVVWSAAGNGTAPFNQFPVPFLYLGDGYILLAAPSYVIANDRAPDDVWLLVPINVDALTSTKPASGYSGTSYSVEGLQKTLTLTSESWRDPANQSGMDDYTQDILDSVKDAVVEGTVTYFGRYDAALTMGQSLSIAASGFTVPYGWGTAAVPIVEVELEWGGGGQQLIETRMKVSSRRAHYSAGTFCHPDRTGLTWGPSDGGLFTGGANISDPGSQMASQVNRGIVDANAVNQAGITDANQRAQGGVDAAGAANQAGLGAANATNQAGIQDANARAGGQAGAPMQAAPQPLDATGNGQGFGPGVDFGGQGFGNGADPGFPPFDDGGA